MASLRSRVAALPMFNRVRARNRDVSIALPIAFAAETPASPRAIAVICHLFYPELAPEIGAHLAHIDGPYDLFVSTDTEEKAVAIRAGLASPAIGARTVEVRAMPNRGRDIAPKFVGFGAEIPRYDLVLFVHGKKSRHTDLGDIWRRQLLTTLLGPAHGGCRGGANFRSIMALFDADPALGIVFPQHYEAMREWVGWHHEYRNVQALAARCGIRLHRRHVVDMASGSMFWARPAALAPILALRLKLEDFPVEQGQANGTVAHAIERLVLFACEKAGFRWAKISDVTVRPEGGPWLEVRDATALPRAIRMAGFRLLRSPWPFTNRQRLRAPGVDLVR